MVGNSAAAATRVNSSGGSGSRSSSSASTICSADSQVVMLQVWLSLQVPTRERSVCTTNVGRASPLGE
jgi:hypothetical protein